MKKRSGFTLIEILVVVAIIALLISILLPSLSRAREQAKAVLCGKNLNQIYTASFTYSNYSRDRLPNFGWVMGDQGTSYWISQLSKELGMQTDVYSCITDKESTKIWFKKEGHRLLVSSSGSSGTPWNWMSVSYSGLCDNVDTDVSDTVGRVVTSYKFPTTSLVLIEGRIPVGTSIPGLCISYNIIWNAIWPFITNNNYPLDPSWTRHMKKSNMLFLDGHVVPHTPKDLTHRILWQQEYYHGNMPGRPSSAYY